MNVCYVCGGGEGLSTRAFRTGYIDKTCTIKIENEDYICLVGRFCGSWSVLLEVKHSWKLFSQALNTSCCTIYEKAFAPKNVFDVLKNASCLLY